MVSAIRNGKGRVCDLQSHGTLVMNFVFSVVHIDMITPDKRTVKTECSALSYYTQR